MFLQLFSAKFVLKILPVFLENQLCHEFVSESLTKFDFFSLTYQKPCVIIGLCVVLIMGTCF